MLIRSFHQPAQCLLIVSLAVLVAGITAVTPTASWAQDGLFSGDQFGLDGSGTDQSGETVTIDADYQLKTNSRRGLLEVRANVAFGWHIYSVTQEPGGPTASNITVADSVQYQVIGGIKTLTDAVSHHDDTYGMMVEEHEGEAIWTIPIELAAGVDPENLNIELTYSGQACVTNGSCKPIAGITVSASFKGYQQDLDVPEPKKELKLDAYQPEGTHVALTGKIERADGTGEKIQPGDKLLLQVIATPLDGFHVYAYGTLKEKRMYLPTAISFTDTNGWKIVGPRTKPEPEKDIEYFGEDDPVFQHSKPVTWTFEMTVPEDAKPDQAVAIAGGIRVQTCKKACDPPADAGFSATIPIGTDSAVALKFAEATAGSTEKAVKGGKFATPIEDADKKSDGPKEDKQEDKASDASLAVIDTPEQIEEMARLYDADDPIRYVTYSEMEKYPIGSGGTSSSKDVTFLAAIGGIFLGGMILNLMPCVFPVLGIKVMGFVKQGGEDNAKVRMHGLMFGLGLLVSMWVLCGIILTIKYAMGESIQWGAQMGNPYFVGFIIVLLFLLGLNMAGVFEFGHSLTSVGGKVTNKGGYTSSFMSGVLTTLIATPCSGPFLGTAMSYTFNQPPAIAMVLFTVFGLGIAFPYVVLSFFPPLIKKLPKPGPWMDTFKITMAFALFATVAFFMQAFGQQTGSDGLSWMIMALVVLGLAAFFFGTWGEPHIKQAKRYVFGYGLPLIVGGLGFWMAYDASSQKAVAVEQSHQSGDLAWEAWHPGKIKYSLANRKQIIWVDYTAVW